MAKTESACPCGSGQSYSACCGPLHTQQSHASTAEALMRSRYSAYALKLEAYLLATWHPAHRPAALQLHAADAPAKWLGLEIKRHSQQDADHATVEFIARCRYRDGHAERLHETSRFLRIEERWLYLDALP